MASKFSLVQGKVMSDKVIDLSHCLTGLLGEIKTLQDCVICVDLQNRLMIS